MKGRSFVVGYVGCTSTNTKITAVSCTIDSIPSIVYSVVHRERLTGSKK